MAIAQRAAGGPEWRMLTELVGVRQIEGDYRRRWFQSADEDLIVWISDAGGPVGFQFCYDKAGAEKALTYLEGSGYSCMRVDVGENVQFAYKRSPVLVPATGIDARGALHRFRDLRDGLPADFARYVERHLAQAMQDGICR
jgi:hypothetical protein